MNGTLRECYEQIVRPMKLVTEGTRSAERTAIGWFERLVPEVASIPVSEIASLHLARWKVAWMEQTGLKPQTWNKYYRHVRCVLRDLHDLEILDRIPKCKQLPEDEPPVRVLESDEIKAIYDACRVALWPAHDWIPPKDYWQALVVTAYCTGLRRRDILSITRDNLDEQRLVLFLRQQKTRKLRAIPVNQSVVEHLRRIMRPGVNEIFYSTQSNRQFYREWHRIQEAAGIPEGQHYGVHDLRRTCGSVIYEHAGIHAASEMLAHSSLGVTRRHYIASGVVQEHLRQAVNGMPMPFVK